MKLYIPDASIIIAFFLEEEQNGEKAKQFFLNFRKRKFKIILPSIWTYEAGNKIGRSLDERVRKYQERLWGFREKIFPTTELDKEALKIAFSLMKKYPKISFYDASYHALALATKGTFLTLDKKYYNITKKSGGIKIF